MTALSVEIAPSLLFLGSGLLVTYGVWARRAEPHLWGGIFADIVGHSGRYGYNAFAEFAALPLTSVSVALVVRGLQDQIQGERAGFWSAVVGVAF